MPGSARTSAIGPPQSYNPELDVAKVRHARDLSQARQHILRDAVVDREDHHRVAARRITPELHARDVDIVLAEDGPELTDHARAILVQAHEKAPFGHQVDAKGVDSHGPQLPHQDSAGDLVALHANRDQARIAAMGSAPPLDHLDATISRDQPGVHGVDPVFRERLYDAFDRSSDQEADIVLGQLAFAIELDGAHATPEELHMQGRQALGQVCERSQVCQLLRWERWSV